MMKRYKALLTETWWLWLGILVAGAIGGIFLPLVFFVTVPICLFAFLYFGLMRYDEKGRPKGDGAD